MKKNKKKWAANVVHFKKSLTKRKWLKSVQKDLTSMSRIPKKKVILGRFIALAKDIKSRDGRAIQVADELNNLWQNLNIPAIAVTSIVRKVKTLLDKYDRHQRRPKEEEKFTDLFDITDPNGVWLSQQDRDFYRCQVESGGEVGYCTSVEAPVHPSKLRRLDRTSTQALSADPQLLHCDSSEENTDAEGEGSDQERLGEIPTSGEMKRRRHSTKRAMNLVKKTNLSTHKAAAVCNQLSDDGIDLPTPSQSGVYKACYREAERMKNSLQANLKADAWVLHFDGKALDGKERQVVLVKNAKREIRIAVLTLDNAKSDPIFRKLVDVLDDYNLWESVKMIVADTCNTNTGRKAGVVTLLKKEFERRGLEPPQFIGCEHHILDRILKHVMNQILGITTTSPNISYPFIDRILKNYDELVASYEQNPIVVSFENPGWRDDMKFLFELCQLFKYYMEHGVFPRVKFRKLPSISDCRWNSRAILSLLAFILLPDSRSQLSDVCHFIVGEWMQLWFSNHHFHPTAYERAAKAVEAYPKAAKCLKAHWSREESVLYGVDRSNRCAERAVQAMKVLDCTSAEKLNLRFILTNKDL